MKKKLLIFTFSAATAFITFQSYQNGPHSGAGNRTGSDGTTTGCGTCHGSSTSATSVSVKLMKDGSEVTMYTPGETYDVTLSGVNTNANPKFGFQLTCSTPATSSTQFGTFDNTGVTGTSLVMSNQMVEHNTGLDGTISGGEATYEKTFKWTAPAAGSGTVKFYAVLNSVNGNNMDGSGDEWNFGTSGDITEDAGTSIQNIDNNLTVKVFPNPASNTLHIDTKNLAQSNYTLTIINTNGKTVFNAQLDNHSGVAQISVEQLSAGHYTLMLNNGSQILKAPFVKH